MYLSIITPLLLFVKKKFSSRQNLYSITNCISKANAILMYLHKGCRLWIIAVFLCEPEEAVITSGKGISKFGYNLV